MSEDGPDFVDTVKAGLAFLGAACAIAGAPVVGLGVAAVAAEALRSDDED